MEVVTRGAANGIGERGAGKDAAPGGRERGDKGAEADVGTTGEKEAESGATALA